jgi:hypothetical protein
VVACLSKARNGAAIMEVKVSDKVFESRSNIWRLLNEEADNAK